MLLGASIVITVIVVIVLGIWLSDGNSKPEPTPMYGYYAAPPEHGQQPPDEPEETDTYTECPSCGKKAYREWSHTWIEQFGQGTTAHEGVRHWECTSCGISGHD